MEDWLHGKRAKRAIAKGKKPSVIPYISYGSTSWVRVLGRVLYLRPDTREHSRLRPEEAAVSRVRGWRTFTSITVPFHSVQVLIDGTPAGTATADRGGVIDEVIEVSLEPGWHTITLCAGENEYAEAPVHIVHPDARIGVIADVDDTILKTALPQPLVAAWNSFVLDENARAATPGMPVLLDHLTTHNQHAPVVYLSTGAWNAAPALSRFLGRNMYPLGPLLLTDWGPTHDRWFRSGAEHKRTELRRLAHDFPHIKWILIGDDGQSDEKHYHEFATEHPDSVAAVLIRQLSVGEAVLAGGRSKAQLNHTTSGVPWIYGPNGQALAEELRLIGLL